MIMQKNLTEFGWNRTLPQCQDEDFYNRRDISENCTEPPVKSFWGNENEVNSFQIILAYLLMTVAVFYLIWYFFVKKFDFYRDYSAYGFEQVVDKNKNQSDSVKRDMINEYRHRKKLGEMPPPYPNGWYAIMECDELEVGQAKEVDALGLNLVAWRGQSGEAYVADAYCPHLGAHLGIGGKVVRDCIECPFHGWQFEGCNGNLTKIPYSDSVPKSQLKMWKILERHGFIYLWYHAENSAPTWEPDLFTELHASSKWRYRGRSEFRVTSHIQELPENGADITHFNIVHPSLALSRLDAEQDSLLFGVHIFKHVFSAEWSPSKDDKRKEFEAIANITHEVAILGRIVSFLTVTVEIHQLGPGVVVLIFETMLGRAIMIQTVTPIEPLLQRITHRLYSEPGFFHPFAVMILQSEQVQIARDIKIWNRKTFIKNPILTKEDRAIKEFRRWFSQFYSKNSVPFTLNRNNQNNIMQFKTTF